MSKTYDFKINLISTYYLELTEDDFESIGITYDTATEKDVKRILNSKLTNYYEYDNFTFEEEKEDN